MGFEKERMVRGSGVLGLLDYFSDWISREWEGGREVYHCERKSIRVTGGGGEWTRWYIRLECGGGLGNGDIGIAKAKADRIGRYNNERNLESFPVALICMYLHMYVLRKA